MSNTSSTASGGIGLGGAIFLIFLVLKLTGSEPVASWSWWWVTSPLWIPFGLVFAIWFLIAIVAGIFGLFGVASEGLSSRRKLKRMMRDID